MEDVRGAGLSRTRRYRVRIPRTEVRVRPSAAASGESNFVAALSDDSSPYQQQRARYTSNIYTVYAVEVYERVSKPSSPGEPVQEQEDLRYLHLVWRRYREFHQLMRKTLVDRQQHYRGEDVDGKANKSAGRPQLVGIHDLHEGEVSELVRMFPPKKRLFSRSKSTVEQRQSGLASWMNQVLDSLSILPHDIKLFLGLPLSLADADDQSESSHTTSYDPHSHLREFLCDSAPPLRRSAQLDPVYMYTPGVKNITDKATTAGSVGLWQARKWTIDNRTSPTSRQQLNAVDPRPPVPPLPTSQNPITDTTSARRKLAFSGGPANGRQRKFSGPNRQRRPEFHTRALSGDAIAHLAAGRMQEKLLVDKRWQLLSRKARQWRNDLNNFHRNARNSIVASTDYSSTPPRPLTWGYSNNNNNNEPNVDLTASAPALVPAEASVKDDVITSCSRRERMEMVEAIDEKHRALVTAWADKEAALAAVLKEKHRPLKIAARELEELLRVVRARTLPVSSDAKQVEYALRHSNHLLRRRRKDGHWSLFLVDRQDDLLEHHPQHFQLHEGRWWYRETLEVRVQLGVAVDEDGPIDYTNANTNTNTDAPSSHSADPTTTNANTTTNTTTATTNTTNTTNTTDTNTTIDTSTNTINNNSISTTKPNSQHTLTVNPNPNPGSPPPPPYPTDISPPPPPSPADSTPPPPPSPAPGTPETTSATSLGSMPTLALNKKFPDPPPTTATTTTSTAPLHTTGASPLPDTTNPALPNTTTIPLHTTLPNTTTIPLHTALPDTTAAISATDAYGDSTLTATSSASDSLASSSAELSSYQPWIWDTGLMDECAKDAVQTILAEKRESRNQPSGYLRKRNANGLSLRSKWRWFYVQDGSLFYEKSSKLARSRSTGAKGRETQLKQYGAPDTGDSQRAQKIVEVGRVKHVRLRQLKKKGKKCFQISSPVPNGRGPAKKFNVEAPCEEAAQEWLSYFTENGAADTEPSKELSKRPSFGRKPRPSVTEPMRRAASYRWMLLAGQPVHSCVRFMQHQRSADWSEIESKFVPEIVGSQNLVAVLESSAGKRDSTRHEALAPPISWTRFARVSRQLAMATNRRLESVTHRHSLEEAADNIRALVQATQQARYVHPVSSLKDSLMTHFSQIQLELQRQMANLPPPHASDSNPDDPCWGPEFRAIRAFSALLSTAFVVGGEVSLSKQELEGQAEAYRKNFFAREPPSFDSSLPLPRDTSSFLDLLTSKAAQPYPSVVEDPDSPVTHNLMSTSPTMEPHSPSGWGVKPMGLAAPMEPFAGNYIDLLQSIEHRLRFALTCGPGGAWIPLPEVWQGCVSSCASMVPLVASRDVLMEFMQAVATLAQEHAWEKTLLNREVSTPIVMRCYAIPLAKHLQTADQSGTVVFRELPSPYQAAAVVLESSTSEEFRFVSDVPSLDFNEQSLSSCVIRVCCRSRAIVRPLEPTQPGGKPRVSKPVVERRFSVFLRK